MKCRSCGKLDSPQGECFFCMWWGSSLVAGAAVEIVDEIIAGELTALRMEKRGLHEEMEFVPKGTS